MSRRHHPPKWNTYSSGNYGRLCRTAFKWNLSIPGNVERTRIVTHTVASTSFVSTTVTRLYLFPIGTNCLCWRLIFPDFLFSIVLLARRDRSGRLEINIGWTFWTHLNIDRYAFNVWLALMWSIQLDWTDHRMVFVVTGTDSNGKEDLPFAHRETWSPLQVSTGDEPSR